MRQSSKYYHNMKQNIVAAFYWHFAINELLFIALEIRAFADSNNLSPRFFNGPQITHNLTFSQQCCFDTYHNDKTTNEYDSTKYLDIMSQDDVVQQQYLNLPYPPVRESDILNEQMYYSGSTPSKPLRLYYALSLENINHFLFRGSSDFRYDEIKCLIQYKNLNVI